jgi:serine/threonine protein kinase/tetratricopeptide (TPR) repeat protein
MNQKILEVPFTIGPYKILQNLGRGGMGEVFLAEDPSCGRSVALKRIRPDLKENKTLQSRFLREARVASVLTHPSIVPILSVQTSPPDIYYTMPFVEGETLRQILRKTREQEKLGDPLHPIGRSIPSLTRIYLQVCEAVAYTHSKGILHRDLKPENIIVGKFGEVMILDWGIADFLNEIKDEDEPIQVRDDSDLTRPGKITGTLAYMPPERLAAGNVPSVQTDVYALGVILYQLLTLQLPFQRKTIASFRKTLQKEELIDAIDMAPYRDVPHQLAAVCKKCLAPEKKDRYKSVEELIGDIKNYIEGRPEWTYLGELDLLKEDDWQFQEHILLAKNIAITRSIDVTEWVALAISSRSFPENIRMDAEVEMKADGKGIGFLLSVPEADGRKSLEEGYCVWLGTQKDPTCRLFRNNVQVMEAKGIYLKPKETHQIRIEKVEEHLKFYLDGHLRMELASHLPLAGTHVGFLQRDADFELKKWSFYDASHNLTVSCLSVPNAFLSHKFYDLALREYRRIGQSFPGRAEGREALFRAGLTLLEKGKAGKEEKFAHLALKEFEKLYRTPGAPLEYLGKSLVYEALGDAEEEAKCLELALRKFPKHSLLPMLKEHIVYRMHESSLNNREAAYRIILLSLRHIPDLLDNPDTRSLLVSLKKNWEPLLLIEESEDPLSNMAIQLAFCLGKTAVLVEMAQSFLKKEEVDEVLLSNAVFSLLELDALDQAKRFLDLPYPRIAAAREALEPLGAFEFPEQMGKWEYRCLHYRMKQALQNGKTDLLKATYQKLGERTMTKSERVSFDCLEIWRALLQKEILVAEKIFQKYPPAALTQESSPLHFLYGAWIYLQEGPKPAMIHFGAVLETPYPTTNALPSLFLAGRIDEKKGWIERAFWWEKKELYRQLDLFHRAIGIKVKHEKT